MNIPSESEFRHLLESDSSPCISIVLTTHRAGVEKQTDVLKLRHAMRDVEHRFHASGLRSAEVESLLQPIHVLLEDEQFWLHAGDGLALYRSAHVFRSYRLPAQVRDHVVISDHFYLKPLLPFLVGNGRYYILAFSQNDIRLLEGTRYSIEDVALPAAVPVSLAQALKYDETENEVRYHSSASGAQVGKGGRHAVIFHGQGVGIDDSKDRLLRYFQQIDRGLRDLLHDATAPLLLAGVAYLLPIYREANTYPHLLEEGIAGNPDKLQAETLHEQAWAIIEPYVLQPQHEAAARYKDAAGTELASNTLREVLPAACNGRVESLFVALDQEQWGSFDVAMNTLSLHAEAGAGSEDLLDEAARQTLLHGGAVYGVERAAVPGEALVAAVFRY